ncbi:MAG TPA: hypothetical protein VFV08_03165 [Puia sp.]|nr:hypothetical protein [Puia sp.]
MEPLNKQARRSAINKFIGISIFCIILVILASYFLFNTPASIFKNKILSYKATEEEQSSLLAKIDRLTGNLKNIIMTDEKYLSSTNEYEKGNLLGNLQEYQKNINDGLVNLKNDSALYTSTISRQNSFNYISAYNAIVAYRNTITSLQKTIEQKGGDATELLKLKSQLDLCNQQLDICKLLAAKPAAAPAGGSGGGSSSKEAELQKTLEKCQSDLAACQKAKAGTVAPPPVVTSTVSDDTRKAQILFDASQDLYTTAQKTKNLIERRGILSAAKQMLQQSSTAYPEKDKLNKAMNQIDSELKKLSNMG